MERTPTNRLAEIVELFPAFRTVVEEGPECCERILADNLSPELATERDLLLLTTAWLYQQWHSLGVKVQREQETNALPIM